MALRSPGNEAVGGPQRGQRIATGEDEIGDPGRPQRLLALARPAGEIDVNARRCQRLGGGNRLGSVPQA